MFSGHKAKNPLTSKLVPEFFAFDPCIIIIVVWGKVNIGLACGNHRNVILCVRKMSAKTGRK